MTTTLQFEAIGTKWTIDVSGDFTDNDAQIIQSDVKKRIKLFDRTYSRFRSDSTVQQWRTPGIYKLPLDAGPLFAFYKDLYDITDGLVTPFIGSVMEQAGYDADYSFEPKTIETPKKWNDLIEIKGNEIHIKRPVVFDIGAAGKGYLIDILTSEIANTKNVTDVTIDAGGDIRNWAKSPSDAISLRVGLENPNNLSQVIAISSIVHQSICASSGSRRKWREFHHIINPKTHTSPTTIQATWVKADTAMVADGLATALYFVTPTKLSGYTYEYAILNAEGVLSYSSNMLEEVFTK